MKKITAEFKLWDGKGEIEFSVDRAISNPIYQWLLSHGFNAVLRRGGYEGDTIDLYPPPVPETVEDVEEALMEETE